MIYVQTIWGSEVIKKTHIITLCGEANTEISVKLTTVQLRFLKSIGRRLNANREAYAPSVVIDNDWLEDDK